MSKKLVILLFIIILAIVLRIYGLEVRPLYGDEMNSLKWSSLNVKEYIVAGALQGDEKPLYYILLHLVRSFSTGSEIIAMRYLSVIAGVLSVIMIFVLAKTLINQSVGFLSAFILAISPFHIYYSQEIRMYILQTLFEMISFYLFLNFFTQERKIKFNKIGYILASSVAIHFHITSILMLLVQNIFFFIRKRKSVLTVKNWILMQIGILLLTPQVIIPLIYIFGYKYGNWINYIPTIVDKSYNPFPIMDIPKTYFAFSMGYFVRELKGNLYVILTTYLFFASIFILGIKRIFNDWRENSLLLLWCFLPVFALLFLFVILKNPYEYRSRYVLISSFAYYIILAAGIESIKHYFSRILLIGGIIIFSIISLLNYYNFQNLSTHYLQMPVFKNYCLLSCIYIS